VLRQLRALGGGKVTDKTVGTDIRGHGPEQGSPPRDLQAARQGRPASIL
jgi:hypothetical protein